MQIIEHPIPHYDERKCPIDMIVLHATATDSVEQTFSYWEQTQAPNRLSAHYVIDRDGQIYRVVDESKRAWHAGVSFWHGWTDINSHAVGIEFQCPARDNVLGDFSPAQIEAGIALCRDLVARYHITADNIVRHSDIAPGRKIDPGDLFPFDEFVERVMCP
ncbi:MAG: N-acetylmuramoyl-L-alanine amidase [Alphaproteobacteria bacterium]